MDPIQDLNQLERPPSLYNILIENHNESHLVVLSDRYGTQGRLNYRQQNHLKLQNYVTR